MAKKIVKIAELVPLTSTIDISEEQQIEVRGLTLKEMVKLFLESAEVFLPLYAEGMKGIQNPEALAPFLLTGPEVVAKIIALASDEPDAAETIQTKMVATVQLVALYEIWKLSVPDSKKAQGLLSEVMALLRKVEEKAVEIRKAQRIDSQTTSLQPLNS